MVFNVISSQHAQHGAAGAACKTYTKHGLDSSTTLTAVKCYWPIGKIPRCNCYITIALKRQDRGGFVRAQHLFSAFAYSKLNTARDETRVQI